MVGSKLKMRAVLVLQLLTCSQAGSGNYSDGADFDRDDTGPYMDGNYSDGADFDRDDTGPYMDGKHSVDYSDLKVRQKLLDQI